MTIEERINFSHCVPIVHFYFWTDEIKQDKEVKEIRDDQGYTIIKVSTEDSLGYS